MLPDQGSRDALKGRVRETPESPFPEVVFTFWDRDDYSKSLERILVIGVSN